MAGIDYATIEAALQAWLMASTGLAAGPATGGMSGVYNELAKVPQPAMPFATFKVGAPRPQSTHDEEVLGLQRRRIRWAKRSRSRSSAGARSPSRVEVRTKAATGSGTAKELLSAVETGAQKPSRRDAFNVAGLAFLGFEAPIDLSARLGPVGQGRVVQDFHFSCLSVDVDKTGYIASMGSDGSGTSTRPAPTPGP
jgi:hypothetical protein